MSTQGTEGLVGVASDYRLAGVDWDYYIRMTQILEYTFNHPDGFAGHFAWQGEGEWRVQNLWRDEPARERFFAEYAVDRLSRGLQLLGAVSTVAGVTDVEPIQSSVSRLVLGPRSRAFADIGEDRDGSAIHVLGGDPVAIELDVGGMRLQDYELVFSGLGYDAAVPPELISHHAMTDEDGVRILETWSDRDCALATLETMLLPVIERIGVDRGREFLAVRNENAVARISLSPDLVGAFGF